MSKKIYLWLLATDNNPCIYVIPVLSIIKGEGAPIESTMAMVQAQIPTNALKRTFSQEPLYVQGEGEFQVVENVLEKNAVYILDQCKGWTGELFGIEVQVFGDASVSKIGYANVVVVSPNSNEDWFI